MRGWDGGIRTPECWDQNPVPYHLANPQYGLLQIGIISLGGVLVKAGPLFAGEHTWREFWAYAGFG